MNRLVALLAEDRPVLWVAADDYAARLFADEAPWGDVAALAGWQRRAQALLRSDVVALPLSALVWARLDQLPRLATAMAAKSRPAFALRTLLGDAAIREHCAAAVQAVASTVAAPLVLGVPDPGPWLVAAHCNANDAEIEVDADLADDAAAYVADFLRGLSGIDGLLVDGEAVPAPLVNVARHFGWLAGGPSGPDFAVSGDETPGVPTFVDMRPGRPGSPPRLRYHEVASDETPEAVLARLAELRS